jgi:hypothetical protein
MVQIENKELERLIISHIIRDETFFLRCGEYLKTQDAKKKSYFSDPKMQSVLNIVAYYFKKRNHLPTKDEIFTFIEDVATDEEQKIYIKKTAELIYDIKTTADINFVEEETINFIKRVRAVEAILLSKIDIENGKYDGIENRLREAVNINFDKDFGFSVRDIEDGLKLIRSIDDGKASLGFPCFDRSMGLLQPKQLVVFASPPSVGKSIALVQTAINNFSDSKKVVFFTLEMSTKRCLSRMYRSLFNKTSIQILNEGNDSEYVSRMQSGTGGEIIIKEYGANFASSNMFDAFINDLRNSKRFEPDIIVVDYLLIMKTNEKLDTGNSFKYYKTVSEELRNLSAKQNAPVVTACQLNRDAQGDSGTATKANVSSKSIAESRGVLDTADSVLLIQQTAQEKTKFGKDCGLLRMNYGKNREGSTSETLRFKIDYETMSMTEYISEGQF